jgi:hypothetical protein
LTAFRRPFARCYTSIPRNGTEETRFCCPRRVANNFLIRKFFLKSQKKDPCRLRMPQTTPYSPLTVVQNDPNLSNHDFQPDGTSCYWVNINSFGGSQLIYFNSYNQNIHAATNILLPVFPTAQEASQSTEDTQECCVLVDTVCQTVPLFLPVSMSPLVTPHPHPFIRPHRAYLRASLPIFNLPIFNLNPSRWTAFH